MKAQIKTKIPGPKSEKYLRKVRKLNLGYNDPYPFVHSGEGEGCYFKDIDGNTFLDFACQIASNPLGYNHSELIKVVKQYTNHPVKYAGQDFTVKEHVALLEELTSITPPGLNKAFLINSGAEAVENCIKLALRKQKQAKFGVSFHGAFHGRTLGALSCTDSKVIQKKNFLSIPMKRLPYTSEALEELDRLLLQENAPQEMGFIIIEALQGEGGYNVAPSRLIKGLREFTKTHGIPLIADEVQAGVGRTGKWWAINHYNVKPDLMSTAKALQVGAAVASKAFDVEGGSISSTWGGGHVLDMALGLKTIQIIKKKKMLTNNTKTGLHIMKGIESMGKYVSNVRGRGLMIAFDLQSKAIRNNVIVECARHGLVLLGCGQKGIRIIPPYVVTKNIVDEALAILEGALKRVGKSGFKHRGSICNYLACGEAHA
jgi:4-aminobutyrate aminotransferase